VVDRNTWAACGREAEGILGNRFTVETVFLDADTETVHADDATLTPLVRRVREVNPSGLLAVGSGTINDLCKASATEVGLPLVTVATAASMNGYTSAIAALTVNGLKVTQACRPPLAVIADPEVLSTAPRRMGAAGFGDLLSKSASSADWLLSHLLFDTYFCPLPVRVVDAAIEAAIGKAEAIRENRLEGLSSLSEALLRSGISMVLAGSSSPASGGEHLVSHLWDMTAHWSGRPPALHGEQTGVTTLVSLALYERLLALDEEQVRRMPIRPAFDSFSRMEEAIGSAFRELAPAVLPEACRKYVDHAGLTDRRRRIVSRWDRIRSTLRQVVVPARLSAARLEAAGAVTRIADLGVSREELGFAYRYARWIRDRYTVLDLAADLGVLETWEEEVLAGAGVVG
jgi:glycerol-1-phosphate dehydrogenase [NAD(P)+]